MGAEKILLEETRKWLAKLEEKSLERTGNKQVDKQLENVEAYVRDCRHFLEKRDLVRAFEAIIYAWGIYETLSSIHLIKDTGKGD